MVTRGRRRRDAPVLVWALAALAGACSSSAGSAPSPDAASSDVAADSDVSRTSDLAPDRASDEATSPDTRSESVTPDARPDALPLLGYPPAGHQPLRGHLVFGQEMHAFQSCKLPALTWVHLEGNEPGIDKLSGLVGPCGPASCAVSFVYVELDANVLGPCPGAPVGHVGRYACSLRIDNLRVALASSPPDCPVTAPAFP
jgi:hypothetical protein